MTAVLRISSSPKRSVSLNSGILGNKRGLLPDSTALPSIQHKGTSSQVSPAVFASGNIWHQEHEQSPWEAMGGAHLLHWMINSLANVWPSKGKDGSQQPLWWAVAIFQLNRSAEKQQITPSVHHWGIPERCYRCNPACQDRDKRHIHFQGVCFPLEQTISTPLHVPSPQYLCQRACPPQGTKGTYSMRDKTSVQRSTFFDCLLPIADFSYIE